jgi:hypothetical protein
VNHVIFHRIFLLYATPNSSFLRQQDNQPYFKSKSHALLIGIPPITYFNLSSLSTRLVRLKEMIKIRVLINQFDLLEKGIHK